MFRGNRLWFPTASWGQWLPTVPTSTHHPPPSLPHPPSPHRLTHKPICQRPMVSAAPPKMTCLAQCSTHTHTHRSQLSMLRCLIVSARPKPPGQIKCARLPSQHYRTKPSHPPEIGPGMWCQSGTQHRVFFNSWPTGIVTQFSKEIGPRCSRQCYKPLCHKRKDIGVSWDKQKIKSLHWQ